MDRDSILSAHVLKHPPQPVIGDGGDQVRHDAELGAAERCRDGIAAERDRIGGGDMFLVAGRHMVGDEGNVDIGLSDEEGLHSCSVWLRGGPGRHRTLALVCRIIRRKYSQSPPGKGLREPCGWATTIPGASSARRANPTASLGSWQAEYGGELMTVYSGPV